MENKIGYVDICCGLNWGDEKPKAKLYHIYQK